MPSTPYFNPHLVIRAKFHVCMPISFGEVNPDPQTHKNTGAETELHFMYRFILSCV